ncbi:hypothetical protein [Micromonospora humi]|uniref:hypothetical protein n=1 Tax=Micromonospora humi TaxID=745366 RepID=UPI001112D525|nr:hypothetical protein [Micromonospora humi]
MLDPLPWQQNPYAAREQAVALLQAETGPFGAFSAWFAQLSSDEFYEVDHRSVEKTTHNKWYLGHRRRSYYVWLHQYQSPAIFAQAGRFAASVHNHRYAFCSLVLSGALTVTRFTIKDDDVAVPAETSVLGVGSTMSLSSDDVHRVDAVEKNTLTLLIQAHESRHYSTRYRLADGSRDMIPDHTAQRAGLLALLKRN